MCYLQYQHLPSDGSPQHEELTLSREVGNMLMHLMSGERFRCCQTFDLNLIGLIWHSATGYIHQEVKLHNKDNVVEAISIHNINNRSSAFDCGLSKALIISGM